MKKIVFALVILTAVMPVFAQNNSNNNESSHLYYVNVRIEKIYPSGDGYVVQYLKSNSQFATIGIPMNWFYDAGSKAELLLLPPGLNWPTMSVFYNNGEFSHVRLYVHQSKGHSTWGNVPQGANLDRFFPEDQETLNFQF